VKVIVPFGAGGPADVTARQIGSILQEEFSASPFVIENRTGAGALSARRKSRSRRPMVYTLLICPIPRPRMESLVPQRNTN